MVETDLAGADNVDLQLLLTRHVPTLRRFARALLGTQRAGDTWVESALHRLLRGEALIGEASAKVDLLSLLLHTPAPNTTPLPVGRKTIENEAALVERLRALADVERLLLLLVDLEALPLADAARVVGTDHETARVRLAAARARLRTQPRQRVLIVEDESLIALDLAETVRALGHDVVGIAANYRQAIDEAGRSKPTLILADIQLADDRTGIDVANELVRDGRVAVVFITAFPERLLTGTKPEPAFLITKPFDRDMLTVALAQAIESAPLDAAN
ncbi:MAG: response regulator [Geminicoccaceae bacterium]|nr:MAG: response regulator [Geminicoccaceae bacterium]